MHIKRVIIAPLDWGLGHATRCIPVIRKFLTRNWSVTIAGSGDSLRLLKREFPELMAYEIPGYNPVYPRSGSMMRAMLWQSPRFFLTIRNEYKWLKQHLLTHSYDLILSDNRYGFYNAKIQSVIITHQITIPIPGAKLLHSIVNRLNQSLLSRFDECWIPDSPDGITKKLTSVPLTGTTVKRFIGNLSMFEVPFEGTADTITAICSGPEPQRTIFEKLLRTQLAELDQPWILVGGDFQAQTGPVKINTGWYFPFLNSYELAEVFAKSSCIICRGGYSTIMDLQVWNKKAILVPTPGQPEQAYLAKQAEEAGLAPTFDQTGFDLQTALSSLKNYSGFTLKPGSYLDETMNLL